MFIEKRKEIHLDVFNDKFKIPGRFERFPCYTLVLRVKSWACDFVTSPNPLFQIILRLVSVLRSLATWAHTEMIWFIRELLVFYVDIRPKMQFRTLPAVYILALLKENCIWVSRLWGM
jgi:hypothetical protein